MLDYLTFVLDQLALALVNSQKKKEKRLRGASSELVLFLGACMTWNGNTLVYGRYLLLVWAKPQIDLY